MARSGAEENPWIFVHEMTMDGCREAAASPVGSGNDKTPGKPPANDDPSATEEANATSGTTCQTLPLEYQDNTHVHKHTRNISQRQNILELRSTGCYKLEPGNPSGRSSFAMPPGCQQGSFPDLCPELNVPRSMINNLDRSTLDGHLNILSNQSSYEDQKPKVTPKYYSNTNAQPKLQASYQGIKDNKNATKRRGPQKNGAKPAQQHSQDMQNMAAREYRQSDTDQTTEEDAEHDEELSQDPELKKRSRRKDQAQD